jgi:O-antigen/teichoic acid export membrane protein
MSSSTPRKIAFNVIVASLSKILNTAVALGGLMMITRYLGPDQFGLYVTALAFNGLFNALGDWGLYQTVTREISRPNASEKTIIGNIMALRIVLSITLAIVLPFFIYILPYTIELKISLLLILLSYIFYSFYQILIGLFQKRLIMYKITIVELLGKIVQIFLVFIGIYFDLGLKFIVFALAISMLNNFTIIYFLTRRFIKFKLHFDLVGWKKFLQESWPIGLSVIVTFIYFKADTLLLKTFSNNQAVGIYGAAYKVLENITFFPGMIVGLLMPMFSYYIFKDRNKFKLLVNKNFKIFVILIIPLIIITLFFAQNIIQIIAGPEYTASATVLRIIIFSLSFIFFGMLLGSILVVAKLQKQQLVALIICAIFNVVANLIFIPKYSYLATSFVSVATEFLVVALSGYIIYTKLHFLPKVENFGLIFLAGLLMIIYILVFYNLPFIFILLTAPSLYFMILIVFKVITKQEITMLIKKKI